MFFSHNLSGRLSCSPMQWGTQMLPEILCGKNLLDAKGEFFLFAVTVSYLQSLSNFFFLPQRFFLAYFISVKLSPPFSYLGCCLYFCLPDLPWFLAVELVPPGQAPTPACGPAKVGALCPGICPHVGPKPGGCEPRRVRAASGFLRVKSGNCRVCCQALQHDDQ